MPPFISRKPLPEEPSLYLDDLDVDLFCLAVSVLERDESALPTIDFPNHADDPLAVVNHN